MTKINSIDDLQPNRRNHNKGTERGNSALEKSIRKLGAGRSGLCDKNGEMIGGSHVLEKMNELGIPIKVVPTDGNEWLVVQRVDLDLTQDKKAVELSYADNRTAELNLDYDRDQLRDDIDRDVDLSYLWSEKELDKKLNQDEKDKENNKKKPLKIMLTPDQWSVVMDAIAQTGIEDNGDAIAHVCQKYLNNAS